MYTDRFLFLSSILFPVLLVAAGLYSHAFWTFFVLFPLSVAGYVLRRKMQREKRSQEARWEQFFNEDFPKKEKELLLLPESAEPDSFGSLVAFYDGRGIYDEVGFGDLRFVFSGVVSPEHLASALSEMEESKGKIRLLSGCLKYICKNEALGS